MLHVCLLSNCCYSLLYISNCMSTFKTTRTTWDLNCITYMQRWTALDSHYPIYSSRIMDNVKEESEQQYCKNSLQRFVIGGWILLFFLTDKDFAQINAARFTWPRSKIQLCKWHIKRAIFTRLSSNKVTTRSSGFNPLSEFGVGFPFRGVGQSSQFCPKECVK